LKWVGQLGLRTGDQIAQLASSLYGGNYVANPDKMEEYAKSAADLFAQPLGRMLGVTNKPGYTQEPLGRFVAYISEHAEDVAKNVSDATGGFIPKGDVLFMLNLVAPEVVRGAVKSGSILASDLARAIERPSEFAQTIGDTLAPGGSPTPVLDFLRGGKSDAPAASYVVPPERGLGSLGTKPYADSSGGLASLVDNAAKKLDDDRRAAQAKTPNAQLLDALLKPEEPISLVDSLLKDYKNPTDSAPAVVKPTVKTPVESVSTGLAKETKSTTPAVSFPDTREVLTPEKIQSLAPPAPPAPPKPPATTTTTAPTTPTPVTPTPPVAPITPSVPTKVTEPVKPIDLGSTALMKQLEDQMAVYEKSGMTRDEATNKAVTDLAKSTTTSVSGLQKSLTDTIAANEKSGLTRDQATNKAITDLAKATNLSDAAIKDLIASTAQTGQKDTQAQVAGLQKTLTDTIAANEKSGLTRDAATNKAIADLAKSTGTSDAELKKLIGATSAANQTFTKDQVDGLQKTLTETIAANEAAGMKRTEATDKAIKELATQTKLKDDDLRKLITTTFDTGQKYTKEQIDLLEKALGKQITGVETGITDLSTTFQSYLTEQAKAEAAKQKQAKMGQVAAQRRQTQQVSAKTPPGAEIDYLYDIGGESIFAPTVGSKKQQKESYYDLYDGGLIDDAGSIDDLYNMLGSK
jgi:hypothetical protein